MQKSQIPNKPTTKAPQPATRSAAEQVTITNQTRNAFKRKVIEREKNNYEYINLIPCAGKGKWYEAPDHSALILYYVVQKDRLRPMTFSDDFAAPYYKYEIGSISVADPEKLIQEIKDSGLYESHELVNTDGEKTDSAVHGYAIKLNREFTGAEIEELKEREAQRRVASLKVEHPNALNPGLYLATVEVSRIVSYFYNRFAPAIIRETLGVDATRKSCELLRQYRLMLAASERMNPASQEFCEYVVARLTRMRKLTVTLSVDIGVSADINKKYAVEYARSLRALNAVEERASKMLTQYQERLDAQQRSSGQAHKTGCQARKANNTQQRTHHAEKAE